jgi:hypothetical protein
MDIRHRRASARAHSHIRQLTHTHIHTHVHSRSHMHAQTHICAHVSAAYMLWTAKWAKRSNPHMPIIRTVIISAMKWYGYDNSMFTQACKKIQRRNMLFFGIYIFSCQIRCSEFSFTQENAETRFLLQFYRYNGVKMLQNFNKQISQYRCKMTKKCVKELVDFINAFQILPRHVSASGCHFQGVVGAL